MTDCKQCGDEMATDALPFCTPCLHNGIEDELRKFLPPNAVSETVDEEDEEPPETTEQSGLEGFA